MVNSEIKEILNSRRLETVSDDLQSYTYNLKVNRAIDHAVQHVDMGEQIMELIYGLGWKDRVFDIDDIISSLEDKGQEETAKDIYKFQEFVFKLRNIVQGEKNN